jgi:hypothetical protein
MFAIGSMQSIALDAAQLNECSKGMHDGLTIAQSISGSIKEQSLALGTRQPAFLEVVAIESNQPAILSQPLQHRPSVIVPFNHQIRVVVPPTDGADVLGKCRGFEFPSERSDFLSGLATKDSQCGIVGRGIALGWIGADDISPTARRQGVYSQT